MYKVLNQDGERIIVDTIDPNIHRHLSGREFTANDACIKSNLAQSFEDTYEGQEAKKLDDELTREQAIEAYKEKYGRKPSSKMKTESIIAKL